MGEIHDVDIARDDGILLPSFVLSHLARPHEPDRREQLFHSLCGFMIRERGARDSDWAERPQLLRPIHAARSEQVISADLRTFGRRMRDRIAAGRMALFFLKEVIEGADLKLPKGVKRLSLNQIAEPVADDVEMTDAKNTLKRVWRPSRPVIHLCAAMTVALQDADRVGSKWSSLTEAFADKTFLEQVLSHGRMFEVMLPNSRLRIASEELERFHLAPEPGSKID